MIPKININNTQWSMQNRLLYINPDKKIALSGLDINDLEEDRLNFHTHEYHDVLVYVMEGRFTIELEDGKLFMAQGDVTLIPKGVVHRAICKVAVKCLVAEVDNISNNNKGSVFFIVSIDHRKPANSAAVKFNIICLDKGHE